MLTFEVFVFRGCGMKLKKGNSARYLSHYDTLKGEFTFIDILTTFLFLPPMDYTLLKFLRIPRSLKFFLLSKHGLYLLDTKSIFFHFSHQSNNFWKYIKKQKHFKAIKMSVGPLLNNKELV